MKCIFAFLVVLSFRGQSQMVIFDHDNYRLGSTIKATMLYADKETELPILVNSDISQISTERYKTDAKVNLGKISNAGFYSLGVDFDTISRYYHFIALPTDQGGKISIIERPFFSLQQPIDKIMGALTAFAEALEPNDTLASFKSITSCQWIFSLKLFSDSNGLAVLTTSEICLSGDCSAAQTYFSEVAGTVIPKDGGLRHLCQELFNTPTASMDVATLDLQKFTGYAPLFAKPDRKFTSIIQRSQNAVSFIIQVL